MASFEEIVHEFPIDGFLLIIIQPILGCFLFNQLSIFPESFRLEHTHFIILSISHDGTINKLTKEFGIIGKVKIAKPMFFELLNRPIVYVFVFVLNDTVALYESIHPLCAYDFILEAEHPSTMELLVKELSIIGSLIFEYHQSLYLISPLKPPSKHILRHRLPEEVPILIFDLSITIQQPINPPT